MKCSNCGEEFEGNFCPNCGMPVNQEANSKAQPHSPKTVANPFWDKIVTCKTCGKQIAKTAKRCPYCGAKQHQGALTACYLIIIFTIIAVVAIIVPKGNNISTKDVNGVAQNVIESSNNVSDNGYITKEKYDKIKTGMTYDEVKKIIGSDGNAFWETGDKNTDGYVVDYMWCENGKNIGPNATLTFTGKDLKLFSKSQSGMK